MKKKLPKKKNNNNAFTVIHHRNIMENKISVSLINLETKKVSITPPYCYFLHEWGN